MAIRAPSSFYDSFTAEEFSAEKILKESTLDKIVDNQQYTLQAEQVFISDCHTEFDHASGSYSTYPFYYFGDVKDMCDVDSVLSDEITLNVSVIGLVDASSAEIRVRSFYNTVEGVGYDIATPATTPNIDDYTFTITNTSFNGQGQTWGTIDVKTNGIENIIFVDMKTTGASLVSYYGIFIYG